MPDTKQEKARDSRYYQKNKERLNRERTERGWGPRGPSIGSHATPEMKAFRRAVDRGVPPREAVARHYPAIPPDEINKKIRDLEDNPAVHYSIEKWNEKAMAAFDEEVPPEKAGKALATHVKLGIHVDDGGYLEPGDHDPRDVTNARQSLALVLELSGRKRPEGKAALEPKPFTGEELSDMLRLEKQILEQRLEKEKAIDVTPEKSSDQTVAPHGAE